MVTTRNKKPIGTLKWPPTPSARKTLSKEKIFLLRIPIEMYEQAREKAASRNMSLREFILEAVRQASEIS